jgi:hypothetical protein
MIYRKRNMTLARYDYVAHIHLPKWTFTAAIVTVGLVK